MYSKQVTKWFADDGTEFVDVKMCAEYELRKLVSDLTVQQIMENAVNIRDILNQYFSPPGHRLLPPTH